MERPSSRKPTLGMSGSVSVWFVSERVGDHLKFSICHAFLARLTSDMASNRPSGDGIANAMKLLERSRTETLPSSATFNNALSRSRLCHGSRRLFPSADQSTLDNPLHPFTTRSCVLSEDVERN